MTNHFRKLEGKPNYFTKIHLLKFNLMTVMIIVTIGGALQPASWDCLSKNPHSFKTLSDLFFVFYVSFLFY